jgi:uncharacterized protein
MSRWIDATIIHVKKVLSNAEAGHDWFHIERVYRNAMHIAQTMECNLTVVQLAALLHDIADSKFHEGNESIGPLKAKEWMESIGVDAMVINHVVKIIQNISFKGGNFSQDFNSVELQIVQDADRLDAIGAIGIARAFHYGGFKNRLLYDPNVAPVMNMDKETYKKSTAPTINHFYEKLLLLKNRMNTPTGKAMAEKRHAFMEQFLSHFYAEWEGGE